MRILISALAALFVWVLSLLAFSFTPLQLTLVSTDGEAVVSVNRKDVAGTVYGRPALHRVEIEDLSEPGQVIEFALPVRDAGDRLRIADVSREGNWEVTFNGERVESSEAGNRLGFSIETTSPALPFIARPDGGTVLVKRGNYSQTFDLAAEDYAFREVRLPPVNATTLYPVGNIWQVSELRVLPQDATGEISSTLTVGGGRILAQETVTSSGFHYTTDRLEQLNLVISMAWTFWKAILIPLAFIIFLTITGRAILCLVPDSSTGGNAAPEQSLAIGLSAVALLNNALMYPLAAGQASIALGAACLIIIGYWAMRTRPSGIAGALSFSGLTPGLLSAAVVFFPVGLADQFYLGFLQTDTYFYTNTATSLQDASLLQQIDAGSFIGFGMRSIDLALAASLSALSGLSPAQTWLYLMVTFTLIAPMVTHRFVSELTNSRNVAAMCSWLVAFSAPAKGLAFEAYFSQFMLTSVLILNLYCWYRAFDLASKGEVSNRALLGFVLTASFSVLLYAHFALLPVILFLALWYRVPRNLKLRFFGKSVLWSVLAANVGLLMLANPGATSSFTTRLNEIARYVVFPFHDEPRFYSILLGLIPFHGSPELFDTLSREAGGSIWHGFLADYVKVLETAYAPIFIALSGTLLLCIGWLAGRTERDSSARTMLLLGFAGYLLLIPVADTMSGLYAWAKLSWTTASLVPILIVPVLLSYTSTMPKGSLKKVVRPFTFGLFGFLLLCNVASSFVSITLWTASPVGVLGTWNIQVAGELLHSVDSLEALELAPESLYLERPEAPDQKFQVWAGHLYSEMKSRGIACANCNTSTQLLDLISVDQVPTERPAQNSVLPSPSYP